jgi:predicted Zn-dependent peptidase
MTTIETHRFPNGLTLVLERLPKCKSAGVAVGFPAGGRTEKAEVSGISHYLEHMIFKGTETVKDVDATFQQAGANNNAITDIDATIYIAESPEKGAVKTLELWLHLLSEAAIDAEEFERERGVILSEYFISEDNPDFLVDKNATVTLFKGHQLASTVIGSEETIKTISHCDMVDYFRSWYHPSNAVIWVSGNLSMDQLIGVVERQEDWMIRGGAPDLSYKTFKPSKPASMEIRRGIKLMQIGLALSSPTQSPEDRASLQILASMISSGQSSLLRRKLVLEGELTDRLRTSASSFREAGMFFTTFAVQPRNVPKVLTILTETIHGLRENTATFRESFENARSHAIGSFSASIDMRMMWRVLRGSWETLRRGHCSWDELISSLESLSFEQFKETVTEITRPERIALVLAGDVKEGAAKTIQW